MSSNVAVLSFDQYREFRGSGKIPEFFMDDKQIPAYAFEGMTRQWGTTQEYKLFPQYVGIKDLTYLYDRCDIATNAVDTVPDDVWGKGFTVKVLNKEGEELKDSQLEKDIWQLNQEHKVRKLFNDAHKKARLYGLGIIVLGLADNKNLSDPAEGKSQKLSYLRVFGTDRVTDIKYDKDEKSETYGQITTYEITILGEPEQKFNVHSSRVIHINNGEGPRGKSILLPCYDLFTVLKNTDWSAGESYYQNASPIYIVTWEDVEEKDVEGGQGPTATEIDDIKDDIEDLHVRKRFILPKSWHVEVVKGSGTLPDPGKIWDPIVERIAGGVKIPKQLLLGTSAGALASGEVNLQQYYKNIGDVQSTFAEPLLVEFYSRLQEWGILPEGEFDVEWAPLWEMDEKERAEIAKTKMDTAVLAMGNSMTGVEPLMTLEEVREQILGLQAEMGAGRQVTMKTEASKPEAHIQLLDFNVETLNRVLQSLVDRARAGTPKEQVLEDARLFIDQYAGMAEENARRILERKLGVSVADLPAEQKQRFTDLSEKYLRDFAKILEDSLKNA